VIGSWGSTFSIEYGKEKADRFSNLKHTCRDRKQEGSIEKYPDNHKLKKKA